MYTYDERMSSPLDSLKNNQGEVLQDAANVRPSLGFNRINMALNSSTLPQKFIYTVRHGNSRHNALSNTFTKPISWRFTAKLRANFDPDLTTKGVQDARHSGRILDNLSRVENAPLPITVYTSPLRRCIQTAMHVIAQLHTRVPVVLHIKEGLREWKGYEHNHQSDRRHTTASILALVAQLNAELGLRVRPVVDWVLGLEDEANMRETYVDVDRRVRSVLHEIFADPSAGACVLLVLHNRSNKSVLRVLGHTQDEVHGLDLENCAMLSYLVGRRALDREGSERRAWEEGRQLVKDRELAVRERYERHEQAVVDVQGYRDTVEGRAKLRRLKEYLQQERLKGDIDAAKALLDLYICVPDLDTVKGRDISLVHEQ